MLAQMQLHLAPTPRCWPTDPVFVKSGTFGSMHVRRCAGQGDVSVGQAAYLDMARECPINS